MLTATPRNKSADFAIALVLLAALAVCSYGIWSIACGRMLVLQTPDQLSLRRSQYIDYTIDLTKERYLLYVPPNYSGAEPFGLIVYTSPGDVFRFLPQGWEQVMTEQKCLFLAPQNAGNEQSRPRRLGLAVLGAVAVRNAYNINDRRIYCAGLSGGARIASQLGFYQSDLFKGTIQSCGADFYREVPHYYRTVDAGPYGVVPIDDDEVRGAKSTQKFALITGPYDFRYGYILNIYRGFRQDGFRCRLFNIRAMGHEDCDPITLGRVLRFLDTD